MCTICIDDQMPVGPGAPAQDIRLACHCPFHFRCIVHYIKTEIGNRVAIRGCGGVPCPNCSPFTNTCQYLDPEGNKYILRPADLETIISYAEAHTELAEDAILTHEDADRFQLFISSPNCVCCWEPISKSMTERAIESTERMVSFPGGETSDISIPSIPRASASGDRPTVTLSCSHTVHRECLLSVVRGQRQSEPTASYLRCPYSPLCAGLLTESDLSSLSLDSSEVSVDELGGLLDRVFKPVSALEDTTDAYINATTKACPNQACRLRVTHYHGHACHHIMPTPFCDSCQSYSCGHGKRGCPGCGLHYCYRCEQTEVLVNLTLECCLDLISDYSCADISC